MHCSIPLAQLQQVCVYCITPLSQFATGVYILQYRFVSLQQVSDRYVCVAIPPLSQSLTGVCLFPVIWISAVLLWSQYLTGICVLQDLHCLYLWPLCLYCSTCYISLWLALMYFNFILQMYMLWNTQSQSSGCVTDCGWRALQCLCCAGCLTHCEWHSNTVLLAVWQCDDTMSSQVTQWHCSSGCVTACGWHTI